MNRILTPRTEHVRAPRAHVDRMTRIARLDQRIAELTFERAKVFAEMAEGEGTNLETGRRQPKAHVPHEPDNSKIPEMDRARARAELNRNEVRRRVGR